MIHAAPGKMDKVDPTVLIHPRNQLHQVSHVRTQLERAVPSPTGSTSPHDRKDLCTTGIPPPE